MLEIEKRTMFEMESDPKFRLLLAEYALEIEKNRGPKPCADIEMYYRMEKSGIFHAWAAYLNGAMIGLISVIANIFPHYSLPMASTESWFVEVEHRKTGAGMKLLAIAKEYVEKIGSHGLIISAPINGPLIKVLENSDDYMEMGKVFFARLNHARS